METNKGNTNHQEVAILNSKERILKNTSTEQFYWEDNDNKVTQPLSKEQVYKKIEDALVHGKLELLMPVHKSMHSRGEENKHINMIYDGVKSGFLTFEMFTSCIEHYLNDNKTGLNPELKTIATEIHTERGKEITSVLSKIGESFFMESTGKAPRQISAKDALIWVRDNFDRTSTIREKLTENFKAELVNEIFSDRRSMSSLLERYNASRPSHPEWNYASQVNQNSKSIKL